MRADRGWGIAAGVIGGAIVAGAVANAYAEPVYGGYYAGGYRRCRLERQYDSYGYYVGTARVCRVLLIDRAATGAHAPAFPSRRSHRARPDGSPSGWVLFGHCFACAFPRPMALP